MGALFVRAGASAVAALICHQALIVLVVVGVTMVTPRYGENGYSKIRPKREQGPLSRSLFNRKKSGGVLLSQGVYPQVPSALTSLTSVFGMGTGVASSLSPPETGCDQRQFPPVAILLFLCVECRVTSSTP